MKSRRELERHLRPDIAEAKRLLRLDYLLGAFLVVTLLAWVAYEAGWLR